MGCVSAASGDKIYVNGSSGNDAWDGLTPETAKHTIRNAIGTVNIGGIVYISDGTYSGSGNTNINIDHSMTIMGAGKNKTTITGLDSNRIFTVNNGVTFYLKSLTITNGVSGSGAGILSYGDTTVDDCVFTKCSTTYQFLGGGSAICSGTEATLIIKNSDFLFNNAIMSSTGGGTIYTNGTATISNSNFIGNKAYSGASIYMMGNYLNVNNCNFRNNTASTSGGALTIYTESADVNMHFSSFINNIATIVGTNNIDNRFNNFLNVTSNWWGTNTGPNGIAGTVNDASNWIYMKLNVNPNTIKYGKTSTVTADFNNLYYQATRSVVSFDPSVDHILDGLLVDFSTDIGQITPQSTMVNGISKATFTGTIIGTATVNAVQGSQTLANNINVEKLVTKITVENVTGKNGNKTSIKAVLTDENGNKLEGQTITFSINGNIIGEAITDNTGTATLNYILSKAGNFTVRAYYNGNSTYSGISGFGSLNVTTWSELYLVTKVNNTNPKQGDNIKITYKLGNRGPDTASNVMISFIVPEGLEFVTVNVDEGKWTFNPLTRTLIWSLNNVVVGDPTLNLVLKAIENGEYTITPTVSPNTSIIVKGIETLNINVQKASNNTNNNTNTGNGTDIPMQSTGAPIIPLLLGVLMMIAGLKNNRKN
jgi:uncharacterized repeat protein (TIGR01451 family)